ncbi:MAG TPA: DNA polymerase [Parcubacteria group bacterium]|jgi:DNA polymerase-1|nr:DNA polymerase [Parcubacteria group bacterium]
MVKNSGKKQNKKTLVLLDVHAILHRAYHALPEFKSSKGEPTGALYGLCTFLIKLTKDVKPDYIIACNDLAGPTMRHDVYDGYKDGRKKTDDALVAQFDRALDVFKAMNIPIYSSPGFEADDILGTIVEKLKDNKDVDIIIASGDMDTMQLIHDDKVRVYTLKKGIKDTIIYNEEAVKERFGFGPELLPDYKGLRGDPSDNIIGIKGIGEKTAEELIINFGTIEDIYKKLKKDEKSFEKAGIKKRIIELLKAGEEEALFSKMLATIRRDAPIHFTLPEKVWRDEIDMKKVQDLFVQFEFRTLGAKVAEVLSLDVGTTEVVVDADPREVKEVGLMLWVIDSNKTNPDINDILSYTRTNNISDAKKVLQKIIKDQNLSYVLENIEMPLMPITEKMTELGVKIDIERLKELSKKYHKELDTLEKKIWKIVGEEFNISSPKQLGEMLFVKMGLKPKNQKKTATGGFSTKESELEKLREVHPIADLILQYREFSKLLGTYIDAIPTMVDKNNRLHSEFLQAGAATGRMASQNPGIQNIPNKTELGREIRKSFIAEKGWKLVSFDYSQVELRIGAFLSGDKKLIEIFKNGEDVHTAVAREVFGVEAKDVTKEMRSKAKVINFGVMYGMGVTALQKNIGTDRAEAQEFLDGYFNKFSGLAEYLENVKRETAQKGYTETFFGRRRYFPDINSKLPFMKASAERMAINAPIQGTGADITKLAMLHVDEFIKSKKLENDVRLLLQVHDELVYEVKENIVESVAPEIKKIMQNVIDPKKTSGVTLATNASVGDNWMETTEIK